ncbi:hypothetical protein GEMRC1_005148 [Eukaryota sp. GEM-RC1]
MPKLSSQLMHQTLPIAGVVWKKLDNTPTTAPLAVQKLEPISFYSKLLSPSQRNWPIIQKELFALIYTLNQPALGSFLLARFLTIFCDHKNLVFLINQPEKSRIVTRWMALLSNSNFELIHVEGENNLFANLLSRLTPAHPDLKLIPNAPLPDSDDSSSYKS